jgi:ssDNA-binding Zn-finger/Zn-ribbon topoisomerase 1
VAKNNYQLPEEYLRLLRRYYAFYRSLKSGERKPETESQRHFVGVCCGSELPGTAHELAYVTFAKYCELARITEEQAASNDFVFPAFRSAPVSYTVVVRLPRVIDDYCPRCAKKGIRSPLVWRHARDPSVTGEFCGCSRFPECRYKET